MSLKLYSLKVSKKIFLSKDTVEIFFHIPCDLKEIFRYRQGQFLSIQVNVDGIKYRREYSFCTSPFTDSFPAIASKVSGKGIVSKYLYHSLNEGDVVEVYPPQGKFFSELNETNKKLYLLVGGGSGITPLISILKSVLFVERQSKIILYYGSKDEDSIIFRNELDEIHKNNKDAFELYYTLENAEPAWKGLKGKINEGDLDNILINNLFGEKTDKEVFICGPEEMMQSIKDFFIKKNISNEKIHIEHFASPVTQKKYTPAGEIKEENKVRKVKIILDGIEHEINVKPETVILDAALQSDIDPPYSCKSGICSTCRAKLYSGKVKMDEREGLSDSEIEEGYILTCQSHPLTDDVKLEYM